MKELLGERNPNIWNMGDQAVKEREAYRIAAAFQKVEKQKNYSTELSYFIQDADGVPFIQGDTALILDTDQHPTIWANVTWRAWLHPYPLSLTPASLQEKYSLSATKTRKIASHIRRHYGFGEKFLAANLEGVVLDDMVIKKWRGLDKLVLNAYEWEVNAVKQRLNQNNDSQLLRDVEGRGENLLTTVRGLLNCDNELTVSELKLEVWKKMLPSLLGKLTWKSTIENFKITQENMASGTHNLLNYYFQNRCLVDTAYNNAVRETEIIPLKGQIPFYLITRDSDGHLKRAKIVVQADSLKLNGKFFDKKLETLHEGIPKVQIKAAEDLFNLLDPILGQDVEQTSVVPSALMLSLDIRYRQTLVVSRLPYEKPLDHLAQSLNIPQYPVIRISISSNNLESILGYPITVNLPFSEPNLKTTKLDFDSLNHSTLDTLAYHIICRETQEHAYNYPSIAQYLIGGERLATSLINRAKFSLSKSMK